MNVKDRVNEVKGVIPTEEDVRAARFYVQVTEEARQAGIPKEDHWLRFNTPGHKAYFKRGAAMLLRYNLILSPIFESKDQEKIAALEAMYKAVISGPLVRFNKNYGKRGRFAGLALRDKPGYVEEVAATFPHQMGEKERGIALNIYHAALNEAGVKVQVNKILKDWGNHYGAHLTAARYPNVHALDLNVDYQGNTRRLAGRIMDSEGYGLASGIDYFQGHEIYLTKNGNGRIFYYDEGMGDDEY